MSDACYFVKVRFAGERRFYFLGNGRAVRHRLHALMVWDRDKAIAAAQDQLEHGPEYGIVAVAVSQDGRIVWRAGEDTPAPSAPKYGPAAGYRYLVDVTKAGRPVFHVKDDDGRWTDFDEAAYEACADEARRAGVAPGSGYNVHGYRAFLATNGVRFTQHANARPTD